MDLYMHPDVPHTSRKALERKRVVVSREFVFDIRSGVHGGTFQLDENLVLESRRSSSLQQLVLLKNLLDEMDIVFWISGNSGNLISYHCDDPLFASAFSASPIEIGIHKFDWSESVLSHLHHMSFEEIDEGSLLFSHHMRRPFYCASDKTTSSVKDWLKDWRSAEELQECESSVRLKNAMGVGLMIRLYDVDDSGRLSSEADFVLSSSKGKNAERSKVKQRTTFTGRMKLLWLDWMGRRWRVPNEAPVYII
jgi:hypothetical protein